MSDETTLPQAPAAEGAKPQAPAPRSDAEAQQQEQAADAAKDAKPEPTAEEAAKAETAKKNRTREYIAKLHRRAAEAEQRLAEIEKAKAVPAPTAPVPGQPYKPEPGEPTLEQHDFDMVAFQRAHSAWAVEKALKQRDETTKQAETARQQRENMAAYEQKAAEFAEDHPDFFEVVGSIDPQFLTNELQSAVMAHEHGAAIAYHLATHDDDLWQLASIRADLMPAAVARLASRLTATPQQAPAQPIPSKPVSQAPPPAPIVSGRAPTPVPAEKLTDDEWFKREQAKRRG